MKCISIKGLAFVVALAIINILVFSNLSVCCGDGYKEKELELSADIGEGTELLEDGRVFISPAGGHIEIGNINHETATITLIFSTGDNRIIAGKLFSTDEGRKYTLTELENFQFNGKYHMVQKAFLSQGELRSLRIEIGSSNNGVYLEKVILNKQTSFRFNFITYGIMLLISGVIFGLKKINWLRDNLNYSDKRQIMAIWMTKGICAILAIFIIASSQQQGEKWFFDYDKGSEANQYNIYMALFDSFHQGTVKLTAFEVDPRLQDLENAYDYSERIETGVAGRWDTAYYQGNYYCYFGILPIIALFEVFYIFTGHLPGVIVVTFLLFCFGICFLFGATRKILEYFEITPKLSYYLLANFVLLFASFYYIIICNPSQYTLPAISGIDFLLASIYFAYGALLEKQRIWRALKFILCGVAFVGIAASRPPIILMGMAFIFPPFFNFLFKENVQWKSKLRDALTFATPVLIGAGALMAYNYVRFDSPFEFGAKYQLTVSDIRYNSVTINFKNILGAIYCYFLEPAKFKPEFPFFVFNDAMRWLSFGKACYQESCMGIFAIPFNLLAFGIFALNKEKSNRNINVLCISILISTFVVAIVNFAMGGAVGRYAGDFAIGIAFLAFLTVMKLSAEEKLDGRMPRLIVQILMISSIVLGILLIFQNDLYPNFIITNRPNIFMFFYNMFDI